MKHMIVIHLKIKGHHIFYKIELYFPKLIAFRKNLGCVNNSYLTVMMMEDDN